MENSKKELSGFLTIDAGFAEGTGVLQSLRDRFPSAMEEMIKLLVAANVDCENHLHQFAFELDGITYLYGRRLNSQVIRYNPPTGIERHPDYIANQHNRREKLERVAQDLIGLKSDLVQLDGVHLKEFIESYRPPPGQIKYDGPLEVIAEIEFAVRVIAACQEAYSSIFKTPVKKRGRKPLPYVEATRALINLWEKYTGERVPASKTHDHKVITHAAKFIYLGISLIDPNVTDAKVVTAINNVLKGSP